MKIPSMGDEMFHADGRMDRQSGRYDEANRRFPQFC